MIFRFPKDVAATVAFASGHRHFRLPARRPCDLGCSRRVSRCSDDAFLRDVDSGIFFDPAKMHVFDHKDEELKVPGPFNIAHPPQDVPPCSDGDDPLRHLRVT